MNLSAIFLVMKIFPDVLSDHIPTLAQSYKLYRPCFHGDPNLIFTAYDIRIQLRFSWDKHVKLSWMSSDRWNIYLPTLFFRDCVSVAGQFNFDLPSVSFCLDIVCLFGIFAYLKTHLVTHIHMGGLYYCFHLCDKTAVSSTYIWLGNCAIYS